MSAETLLLNSLQGAIATPSCGVLGLVDELLAVAREHALRLSWHAGRCLIQIVDGGPAGLIEVPLHKSVVRAVLARIAVLCNERHPDSVSPYGGRGEVSIVIGVAGAIRVAFVNTPEEQRLDLAPLWPVATPHDGGQSLAVAGDESGSPLDERRSQPDG